MSTRRNLIRTSSPERSLRSYCAECNATDAGQNEHRTCITSFSPRYRDNANTGRVPTSTAWQRGRAADNAHSMTLTSSPMTAIWPWSRAPSHHLLDQRAPSLMVEIPFNFSCQRVFSPTAVSALVGTTLPIVTPYQASIDSSVLMAVCAISCSASWGTRFHIPGGKGAENRAHCSAAMLLPSQCEHCQRSPRR